MAGHGEVDVGGKLDESQTGSGRDRSLVTRVLNLTGKDKIIAINTHMITAFLDRYVRGDESRASYLDGLTPRIDDTVWPADLAPRFDMTSTANPPVTLWKGFKRRFATGLELRAAPASP